MTLPVQQLRTIARTEAVSFLVLLGIAMPLKYLAGMPMAVKVVGWAHGVLFVLFCIALARARRTAGWTIKQSALVFIAALVPFGPFVLDGWLERNDRPDMGRETRLPGPASGRS